MSSATNKRKMGAFSRKRRWLLLVLLVISVPVFSRGLGIAQIGLALRQDYEALRRLISANSAEQAQPTTVAQVDDLLNQTESDLRALRDQAGFLFTLTPFLRWMPRYGGDIEQVGPLVDYAVQMVAAGRVVVRTYRALETQLPPGSDFSKMPRAQLVMSALHSFEANQDELQQALDRAALARQRVHPQRLSLSLANALRRGDQIFDVASPALRAAGVVPELLGMRGSRRYLLIAQNNDELRATGGYISGVGVFTIQNAEIAQVDYRDSYAFEDYSKPHPWPPQPLTYYMGAEQWTLRDANWSPDFPTTARQIEDLYTLNQGAQVDGVIAVNLGAVRRLVAAFAPIQLPDYGERVDGDNVVERMQAYFVSPKGQGQTGDWWGHRKDFMGALMQEMVARLNGEGDGVILPRVAQSLWESLSSKDILIYLNDPAATGVLDALNWDGALPAPSGDTVLIVDSNVGFNKVDQKIERRFDYRVQMGQGEHPRATLRIDYQNLNSSTSQACVHEPRYEASYAEMQNTCYWDYVRVYVPLGSRLLSATESISATLESPELGYSVLSGYFVLPRGETRAIQFDYELPFSVSFGGAIDEYRFRWVKQPGAPPAPISLTLTLPIGMRIIETEPAPVSHNASDLQFSLAPDRDATLIVHYEPAADNSGAVLLSLGGVTLLVALGYIVHHWRRRRLGSPWT